MKIEEAIEHCMEQAKVCSIKKCADDHLQLAEWLEELKGLRKLFTLTAEEVEMEKQILVAALLKYVELYHANKLTSTASDWKEAIDYCHKQLTRIKQWQDGLEKP